MHYGRPRTDKLDVVKSSKIVGYELRMGAGLCKGFRDGLMAVCLRIS